MLGRGLLWGGALWGSLWGSPPLPLQETGPVGGSLRACCGGLGGASGLQSVTWSRVTDVWGQTRSHTWVWGTPPSVCLSVHRLSSHTAGPLPDSQLSAPAPSPTPSHPPTGSNSPAWPTPPLGGAPWACTPPVCSTPFSSAARLSSPPAFLPWDHGTHGAARSEGAARPPVEPTQNSAAGLSCVRLAGSGRGQGCRPSWAFVCGAASWQMDDLPLGVSAEPRPHVGRRSGGRRTGAWRLPLSTSRGAAFRR